MKKIKEVFKKLNTYRTYKKICLYLSFLCMGIFILMQDNCRYFFFLGWFVFLNANWYIWFVKMKPDYVRIYQDKDCIYSRFTSKQRIYDVICMNLFIAKKTKTLSEADIYFIKKLNDLKILNNKKKTRNCTTRNRKSGYKCKITRGYKCKTCGDTDPNNFHKGRKNYCKKHYYKRYGKKN